MARGCQGVWQYWFRAGGVERWNYEPDSSWDYGSPLMLGTSRRGFSQSSFSPVRLQQRTCGWRRLPHIPRKKRKALEGDGEKVKLCMTLPISARSRPPRRVLENKSIWVASCLLFSLHNRGIQAEFPGQKLGKGATNAASNARVLPGHPKYVTFSVGASDISRGRCLVPCVHSPGRPASRPAHHSLPRVVVPSLLYVPLEPHESGRVACIQPVRRSGAEDGIGKKNFALFFLFHAALVEEKPHRVITCSVLSLSPPEHEAKWWPVNNKKEHQSGYVHDREAANRRRHAEAAITDRGLSLVGLWRGAAW